MYTYTWFFFFKLSEKYKNYYYLKMWKGKHRSFASRGQESWGIDALALGTSCLGSAVGSGVPGPGEASKVGSGILVMRYCGADWAEEKPEGKKMLLRRGAGVAEVEGWRILCSGGSNRRLMEVKLYTQRQDYEGIHGLSLWLWKAPGEWKHSSTCFFKAPVLCLSMFLTNPPSNLSFLSLSLYLLWAWPSCSFWFISHYFSGSWKPKTDK